MSQQVSSKKDWLSSEFSKYYFSFISGWTQKKWRQKVLHIWLLIKDQAGEVGLSDAGYCSNEVEFVTFSF